MTSLHIRYSNRLKCLLCYLVFFSLPLAWQAAALRLIYPYKLAGTAPNAARLLADALAFPVNWLDALARSCEPVSASSASLRAALEAREASWFLFLTLCALAAWLLTLTVQLLWRARRTCAIQPARATRRAIRAYRLMLLALCALNVAFAALVWFSGMRSIPGRNLWDALAYWGCYPLNVLAAAAVSRLAAPPVISGRHAFFRRL